VNEGDHQIDVVKDLMETGRAAGKYREKKKVHWKSAKIIKRAFG